MIDGELERAWKSLRWRVLASALTAIRRAIYWVKATYMFKRAILLETRSRMA